MPECIAFVLHAVRVLLGYGRHLRDTVPQRAAAPTFSAIAARFGTANLATILAHLHRGILRAIALERMLLAWAVTGRDIKVIQPRVRAAPAQSAPAGAQAEQPAAPPPRCPPASPPFRPFGGNNPEFCMPTLEELERQVRRNPIGQTVVEICRDLGVVPGFCTIEFWDELYDIMRWFGGSLATLMEEKLRREQAFDHEQDSKPGSNWDWLHHKRDAIRQVLGFFIGEEPCAPAAALATGPP